MKKFWQDFKKFISRGNIVDMAVGVIIGTAFSAIVTALTNKIIMPLINYLLTLGGNGNGLESAFTFLKKAYDSTGAIDLANSIYIDWGAFITAILNFFIIALTLFIILRVAMKSSELLHSTTKKAVGKYATKEEKKQMKELGLNYKDTAVVAEYRAEKQAQAEAEAKAAEEARQLEEANKVTTEKLLQEIRDLLKENQKLKEGRKK